MSGWINMTYPEIGWGNVNSVVGRNQYASLLLVDSPCFPFVEEKTCLFQSINLEVREWFSQPQFD